ncbi:putative membrane protein [Acinetobacter baumannii]|uniref:Putative membrane protein n=1 Tax=Acinetobacter baumannii TaxID=470 RepID=A0A7U7Q8K6_ACIBA|nr:putative membrane protein [Acinetobacter baumannii P630]CRL94653.1 putative membrane protein [Acinetobacter baumannii]CUW35335.1 putative membrane protein [Acinetobacter baumannii]
MIIKKNFLFRTYFYSAHHNFSLPSSSISIQTGQYSSLLSINHTCTPPRCSHDSADIGKIKLKSDKISVISPSLILLFLANFSLFSEISFLNKLKKNSFFKSKLFMRLTDKPLFHSRLSIASHNHPK